MNYARHIPSPPLNSYIEDLYYLDGLVADLRQKVLSVGISQNHLGTQFKRLVGIPPKAVARFYRFARVLRLIDFAPTVHMTLISHQTRFYDPSHFNREFLAFTGHSPTEYIQLRRRVEAEHPEHADAYRNLPID